VPLPAACNCSRSPGKNHSSALSVPSNSRNSSIEPAMRYTSPVPVFNHLTPPVDGTLKKTSPSTENSSREYSTFSSTLSEMYLPMFLLVARGRLPH
jgi:hypothetical protein